jgi:hypothetical protein
MPKCVVLQNVRIICQTDEIDPIATKKLDILETHPQRVAERVGNDENKEENDRQRHERREAQVR